MRAALVAGDTGSTLVVLCREHATQTPIDLTGKTVQLRYRIDEGPVVVRTMTVQPPATAGRAAYQFTGAELTAGTLVAEVRIQPGQADQLTSLELLYLPVRAPLG